MHEKKNYESLSSLRSLRTILPLSPVQNFFHRKAAFSIHSNLSTIFHLRAMSNQKRRRFWFGPSSFMENIQCSIAVERQIDSFRLIFHYRTISFQKAMHDHLLSLPKADITTKTETTGQSVLFPWNSTMDVVNTKYPFNINERPHLCPCLLLCH